MAAGCLISSRTTTSGLNGDPRVAAAAKQAIDRYGTSVSASRIVSGERPMHRALEAALAQMHGTEDCVAMVSGHATNVTVIGYLVGPGDAIVHDSLVAQQHHPRGDAVRRATDAVPP